MKRKSSPLSNDENLKRSFLSLPPTTLDESSEFLSEEDPDFYDEELPLALCIPYEIMLDIFTLLSNNEMKVVRCVCTYWNEVSMANIFQWIHAGVVMYCWEIRAGIGRYRWRMNNTNSYSRDITSYSDELNEPFFKCEVQSEKDDPKVIVYDVYINLSILESYLETPKKNMLFLLLNEIMENWRNENDFVFENEEVYMPPVDDIIQIETVEGVSLELKQYQKEAVSWMVHVEKNKPEIKFSTKVPWVGSMSSLAFDFESLEILPGDMVVPDLKIEYKGGLLADEMGMGKTIEVLSLIHTHPSLDIDIENHDYENEFYYPCKATLVVCPSQISKQWVDEINQHSKNKLKVILIETILHLRKLEFLDIMNADVVVVSKQFFMNRSYMSLGELAPSKLTYYFVKHRWEDLLPSIREALRRMDDNGLSQTRPILDFFNWWRIIFDEGHEYMNDNYWAEMFKNFRSTNRWMVTGTPDLYSTNGLFQAIGLRTQFKEPNTDPSPSQRYREASIMAYKNFLVKDFVVKNLFWRNLKSNVKNEYKLAPCIEEPCFIDFHSIEKAMYEISDIDAEFITDGFTDVFYTNKTSIYDLLLNKIGGLNQRIIQKKQWKKNIKSRIPARPLEMEKLRNEIQKLKAKKQVLEDCAATQKRMKKPKIGQPFHLGKAIFQYGTKVGHLIKFVFDTWEEMARILIFSQSNTVLMTIADILAEYGIETSVLYGNVNIKRKAIRDFKEGVKRVMVMNLKGGESGTNLHSATHIMLVDPATKYNIANQAQAIGRAHRLGREGEPVKIVRFIIRDTYEEEEYNKNIAKPKPTLQRTGSLVRSSSLLNITPSEPPLNS